jgi:hypothetical protein
MPARTAGVAAAAACAAMTTATTGSLSCMARSCDDGIDAEDVEV